jgi:predicted nucleic acid-binding protein
VSCAVLLDTGPLVSFLANESQHAAWVHEQWDRMPPPMLTCEAVLTEAAFLLKREGGDPDALFELMQRKVIRVALRMDEEQTELRTLMRRYRDRPMSLADACLVRLSEKHRDCTVFTLDSDFRIYRRHGNRIIPVLMPER